MKTTNRKAFEPLTNAHNLLIDRLNKKSELKLIQVLSKQNNDLVHILKTLNFKRKEVNKTLPIAKESIELTATQKKNISVILKNKELKRTEKMRQIYDNIIPNVGYIAELFGVAYNTTYFCCKWNRKDIS